MSRRSRTVLSGLGLVVLLGGALTACASTAGSGDSSLDPSGDSGAGGASSEIEVDAAWLDNGRMIGIVTQGSSTCVPTAGDVTLDGNVLDVAFVEPEADAACTKDLVPRVTLVAVPEDVDPSQELEIRVTGEGYHGDTDLDGVAGLTPGGETDYQPSAGWTDEDGQFVILTWGSSTCVPMIEDVVAGAPAEVMVTFATPPADQVCTMDMSPRGTIAFVPDLETDSDVFAVLTGDRFDNVRIPILGTD